jgi:uncharacterized protein YcfL
MRILTLVVLAAVSCALLAGCGTKKGFEKKGFAYGCPIGETKVGSMEDLVQSKVAREGPRTNVAVTELRCTMTGDLLKIDANLNNDASDTRRIAYKFRWIDREGMRAAEEEVWKPVLMYEKSNHPVTAVAPTPKAVDFRLIYMAQD